MWDVLTIATPMDITDGLFKTVESLTVKGTTAIRAVAVFMALVAVLAAWTRSKFNLVSALIAGVGAGIVLWLVWNVTDVQDGLNKDLESAPPAVSSVQQPGR